MGQNFVALSITFCRAGSSCVICIYGACIYIFQILGRVSIVYQGNTLQLLCICDKDPLTKRVRVSKKIKIDIFKINLRKKPLKF